MIEVLRRRKSLVNVFMDKVRLYKHVGRVLVRRRLITKTSIRIWNVKMPVLGIIGMMVWLLLILRCIITISRLIFGIVGRRLGGGKKQK